MTPRPSEVHRSTNLLLLQEMGFRPARWLPTRRRLHGCGTVDLRPVTAGRAGRAHGHDRLAAGNLWPLAWILGFEPPPALRGMIEDDTIPGLFAHLPKFDQPVAPFLAAARDRPVDEVDAMEDLFYCAHNAVRSAQLGHHTVPEDFDRVADGGVIHERRHALTWALSPGGGWEETDLST